MWFLKKHDRKIRMEGYTEGVRRGYQLGFIMGQAEERNQIYHISKVSKEIDSILEQKGF